MSPDRPTEKPPVAAPRRQPPPRTPKAVRNGKHREGAQGKPRNAVNDNPTPNPAFLRPTEQRADPTDRATQAGTWPDASKSPIRPQDFRTESIELDRGEEAGRQTALDQPIRESHRMTEEPPPPPPPPPDPPPAPPPPPPDREAFGTEELEEGDVGNLPAPDADDR